MFKENGEILKIKYKPSIKKMYRILECECLDSIIFVFLYNQKEHDNTEIIVDAEFVKKNKQINRIISDALTISTCWRNKVYIRETQNNFVVCGNILVVTRNELIPETVFSIDETYDSS